MKATPNIITHIPPPRQCPIGGNLLSILRQIIHTWIEIKIRHLILIGVGDQG